MRKALILGASLIAMPALPALADGYKDAQPPNPGPAPLSPQAQETYETRKEVRIVREHAPAPHVMTGCCCCAPVAYTRTAPPDCSHDENTVIRPSGREYAPRANVSMRRDRYPRYTVAHNDRADPWAHYDRGWD